MRRALSWTVVLSAAACLWALLMLQAGPASASRWGRDYIPNWPVVTQDGKTVNFYDDLIKNKIVVVSFIYTSCKEICPLATARLSQVQDRLGDSVGRDVFLVSITVDPEHDTPEAMKKYAETFKAGPGWFFITGKPEYIHDIRYKLGERSSNITEHRNDIWLANGATDEWQRDSQFGDIERLIFAIHSLDPKWRYTPPSNAAKTDAPILGRKLDRPNGEALFVKACAGCHTIGKGDRVGPDLSGITDRRERSWITRFVTSPEKMRREHDPIAMSLVEKYPTVRMPNLGLSAADAGDLINYIELVQPKPPPTALSLDLLQELTTQDGQHLKLEELKGRPLGVLFGFTHCPDVCPTTLLEWSNVLQSLGPDGDRFKILFVSVDSERDTPEALKAFMSAFDPRITALTGSPEQIAKVAKAFDAFYEKIEGQNGEFSFDHTVKAYLLDTEARLAGTVDFRADDSDRRKAVAALLGVSSAVH